MRVGISVTPQALSSEFVRGGAERAEGRTSFLKKRSKKLLLIASGRRINADGIAASRNK
jgi:hypothetical protein